MIGKGGIKLALFTDYVIVYINNSKESIEKLLKLINNLTVSLYTRSIYKNDFIYQQQTIRNLKSF